jgi:hypothetical protein
VYSDIEYIKETFVKLLFPDDALGCDSYDDQALVGSRIHVQELALLRLETDLLTAFWVLLRLVQTVCKVHVHLNLHASQVNLVFVVANHDVLVLVVPEERMGSHLNDRELSLRTGGLVRVVAVTVQIVELDGDHAARLWVFDLKLGVSARKLKPVVAVELRYEVP